MTKENTTLIQVVLDRSGSMGSVRDATIEGLNTFITQQQKSTVGTARMGLVQFDDQYEVNYENRPLPEVPLLDHNSFVPRGWTALYDAIGKTIQSVGAKLEALPESERPSKVIFVIQTDGGENASKEYGIYAGGAERIKAMIEHQRTKYNWEFVFLGANQDAMRTGSTLGIAASMSLSYNADPLSTKKAFHIASASVNSSRGGKTLSYGAAGSSIRGATMDANTSLDAFVAQTEALVQDQTSSTPDPVVTPTTESKP